MRLAVFLAVCLVGVFGLYAVFGQLRFGEKTHTYKAAFTNVTGLEIGDFVRIAGVEVGQVKKVAIQPDTTALVEFTADDSVVLTEGSRAVIRYDDLIGGRYLALEEGAGGTKKLNPGDTIPLARTSPALDLDALIGGFRPLFRALDPDQVNALSGQLIAAAAGPGRHDQLVPGADRGADDHAGRPGSADRAGDRQPQHRAGIARRPERPVRQGRRRARRTGEGPGGCASRTSATGWRTPTPRHASITDLLAQARPAIAKTIHETDRAAGIVVADHDYFDNLLNTLPDAYQALARQGIYGDFFSFYLCDVVLKLNGKGGQPVYVKVAGQSTGRCAPR